MRLTSLDIFRGLTIAGMILVNMAGVVEPNVYAPLLHADWNGCTPTDLVFPFFLFIVGVAMSFSLGKYSGGNKPTAAVYWRILRRAGILFALGLFLNGFWNKGPWTFDFSVLRIMGVLQRISFSYLLASLAVLNLPRKGQWILALVLLLSYWLVMMYVPIPGHGIADLTQKPEIVQQWNFASYIDRLVIPKAHLHGSFQNFGDPEGLFSSIPAVVSVLFGYFTGQWIRSQSVQSRTSIGLALFGIGCLIVGWGWDFIFPINKKLWTSSYVVFTTGWALLLLAGCYELIEVRRIRRWGKPFEVLGMNAISIFVASVLLIKVLVKTKVGIGEKAPSTFDWIYQNVFASWAGAFNGSLFFALVTVCLWLAIAYIMYWRRWFIKI
jgi:predicted acyltransferase